MGGGSRRAKNRALPAAAALLFLVALPSCGFVGPTAGDGASLSISANPLFIGLNGESAQLVVIVSQADGNPPPNGTIVFLTSTLGVVPAEVQTDNGRAAANLLSGSQAGVATVTARSGVASTQVSVDVVVGAILSSLTASATPGTLPSGGGTSVIKAVAFGDDGETLANVPVSFSTTAGTLASGGSVVRTNAQGEATDQLTTTSAATITATSGATTATADVGIAIGTVPTASFTFSPTQPRVGEGINFDASTSLDPDGAIAQYRWTWGDGTSPTIDNDPLAGHTFAAAGTFTVTLTVTDNHGDTGSVTVSVTVIP